MHGYVNRSDRLVLSPEKHQNHGVQLTLSRFEQILDVKGTIAYGQDFDMNTEGCITKIKSATIRLITCKEFLRFFFFNVPVSICGLIWWYVFLPVTFKLTLKLY
ncbi:hypothetical protein MKX03_020151 [Papaver bracteatum]|nr:hypothetical protein MKX03_020151 [Papaver bracteatum]